MCERERERDRERETEAGGMIFILGPAVFMDLPVTQASKSSFSLNLLS